MKREIIHFCEDEKFINSAYSQFGKISQNNIIYVYGTDGVESLIHINKTHRIKIVANIKEEFIALKENSILVLHGLPDYVSQYLNHIPKAITVIWLIYGYEIYNDPYFYSANKLLDKHTRARFKQNEISFKKQVKEVVWPLYRKINSSLYYTSKEIKINNLKRVDFFGFGYKEEYESIIAKLGFRRPFFDFMYYPLEYIVDKNQPYSVDRKTILIGHSGFPSVNHIDVFKKLEETKITDQQLIVPFSYGDRKYISAVTSLLTLKNNHIEVITDFMPIEKYNHLLSSVKIAIFNMRRQQAIGNIIALLYNGAKVFLSEKNTFFHFLKRHCLFIYSYEKDLNTLELKSGLSSQQIEANRTILRNLFNEEKRLVLTKKSLSFIL